MSTSIGIRLADGSFYPILKENTPEKKILELTTVRDGQTTVQVDLYRSATDSMDDAEYIDTMQIDGLMPHPHGEPNLSLSVGVDESGVLSAEVVDPETGAKKNVTVSTVMRSPEERSLPPDFALTEIAEITDDLSLDDVPEDGAIEDLVSNFDMPELSEMDTPSDGSIEEDSLPDFSDVDFSVPDFDNPGIEPLDFSSLLNDENLDPADPALPDFSVPEDIPEPVFDNGSFTDSADEIPAMAETGSFDGLFDDPADFEKKERSQTGAVVVCIICAVICLTALTGIFLLVPSRLNLSGFSHSAAIDEPPLPPLPSDGQYLPKENEIVVAPVPDIVPLHITAETREAVRYRIKWGDTLWDLAAAYYRNPWRYTEIAAENNIANPDYIISGTYILIPFK